MLLLLMLLSCFIAPIASTKIVLPAGHNQIRIPRVTETEDALEIFFETVDRPIKFPDAEIITGAYTDLVDKAQLEDGSMRVMPEIDTIDPRLWPEYKTSSGLRLTHNRADEGENDDNNNDDAKKTIIKKRDTDRAEKDETAVDDETSEDRDLEQKSLESSEFLYYEQPNYVPKQQQSLPDTTTDKGEENKQELDFEKLSGVDRLVSILNGQKANSSGMSTLLGAAAVENNDTISSGIISVEDNISSSSLQNETFVEYSDSDDTNVEEQSDTVHSFGDILMVPMTNVTVSESSSEMNVTEKAVTNSSKEFSVENVSIKTSAVNYTASLNTSIQNDTSMMHKSNDSNHLVVHIPLLLCSLVVYIKILSIF